MTLPEIIRHYAQAGQTPAQIRATLERGRKIDEHFEEADWEAVRSFRKRTEEARIRFISRTLATPETPIVTATCESATSGTPSGGVALVSDALAVAEEDFLFQETTLSIVHFEGGMYFTIRSFADAFDKRAENLQRSVEQSGTAVLDILVANTRGERRPAPCVASRNILSVLYSLEERGMSDEEKARIHTFIGTLPDAVDNYIQSKIQTAVGSLDAAMESRIALRLEARIDARMDALTARLDRSLPPGPSVIFPRPSPQPALPTGPRTPLIDVCRNWRKKGFNNLDPKKIAEIAHDAGVQVYSPQSAPWVISHDVAKLERQVQEATPARYGIQVSS